MNKINLWTNSKTETVDLWIIMEHDQKTIPVMDVSSNLEKLTENKTSAGECNGIYSNGFWSWVFECAFQMFIAFKATSNDSFRYLQKERKKEKNSIATIYIL